CEHREGPQKTNQPIFHVFSQLRLRIRRKGGSRNKKPRILLTGALAAQPCLSHPRKATPNLTRMENPFGAWLAHQPHSRLQCSIEEARREVSRASGGPIVFSILPEGDAGLAMKTY